MDYNSDFRYDLKLGQVGENALGKMLSDHTIEVKFDFGTHWSGNFYIEYESRGKASGLATTEAKFWCLIAATKTADKQRIAEGNYTSEDVMYSIIIATARLKVICEKHFYRTGVRGGDNNTSLGYLVKAFDLLHPLP
jgi:hypothetical protein